MQQQLKKGVIAPSKNRGFTLIELMIVVAIIGALSAIALPMYKGYVTKSEASAALATLNATVTPAELYILQNGDFDADDQATVFSEIGISSASSTLGTVSIPETNTLQFSFTSGSMADEGILTLKRTDGQGWQCTATNVPEEAVPSNC
ncbi:pilin [Vibrio sp. WXL210]|uniref:pilin n=1 Tax=Vibrio sp. WXL210 TaxID=3450709 RepID=UPI003EC74106